MRPSATTASLPTHCWAAAVRPPPPRLVVRAAAAAANAGDEVALPTTKTGLAKLPKV